MEQRVRVSGFEPEGVGGGSDELKSSVAVTVRWIVSLSLFASLFGCAHGSYLTPEMVDSAGTARFSQPYQVVVKAVVAALQSEGFAVPVVNAESGIVKTDRRDIRRTARAYGAYGTAYATEVTYYRQYVVRMFADPNGQIAVRAEPRIYVGEADISDRPIWSMDGPQSEPVLWNELFRDISEGMPSQAR